MRLSFSRRSSRSGKAPNQLPTIQLTPQEAFLFNLELYSSMHDDEHYKSRLRRQLVEDVGIFCAEMQYILPHDTWDMPEERYMISATHNVWDWTRTRKFESKFFRSENAEEFARCLIELNDVFRASEPRGGICDLSETGMKRYIQYMEKTKQNYRR